jgi:hypothetical protein
MPASTESPPLAIAAIASTPSSSNTRRTWAPSWIALPWWRWQRMADVS